MKTISTLLFFLFLVTKVNAGLFGPSSYEECIIEGMKGVQSDYAAREVRKACRKSFPAEDKVDENPQKRIWAYEDPSKFGSYANIQFNGNKVSYEELSRITGKVTIDSGFFSNETKIFGSFHNGNASLSVNSIVINIRHKYRDYKYVLDLFISPRKTERFSFPFDWPKDEPFECNIYEAYGTH